MWKPLLIYLAAFIYVSEGVPLDLQPGGSNSTDDCDCVPYYLCKNGTINSDGEGIIHVRQKGECPEDDQVCCKKDDQTEPASIPPSDCDCVAYYLCRNGTINTDGEGIINFRQKEVSCSKKLDVCCKKDELIPKENVTIPPMDCDCVPTSLCNTSSNNTGGIGIINIRQMGSCLNATEVCCKKEHQKPPPITPTPSRINCDCVPAYLCNNGSINSDGKGIINFRQDEKQCSNISHVCCPIENQVTEMPTTLPPIEIPNGCGYRQPNGVDSKIAKVKENESQFGEFPWMVALIRDNGTSETNPSPQCGGALIHPQAVITAAHCIDKKDNRYLIIRAGEWDINSNSERYPHQEVDVQAGTIHPDFNPKVLYNDIAFLYLKSPVNITENVNVVCLPPQGLDADFGRCYSTGWGKDSFGKKGVRQVILKKVDLPKVPWNSCQEKMRKTVLGTHFKLNKSFMCAGGEEGKDACTGDGGSPLVCPIEGQENRFFHAGIVAWGIGCGDKDIPGVYGNVALFRDWIDEQMKLHHLTTDSYTY